jgi:hypothetical protein
VGVVINTLRYTEHTQVVLLLATFLLPHIAPSQLPIPLLGLSFSTTMPHQALRHLLGGPQVHEEPSQDEG